MKEMITILIFIVTLSCNTTNVHTAKSNPTPAVLKKCETHCAKITTSCTRGCKIKRYLERYKCENESNCDKKELCKRNCKIAEEQCIYRCTIQPIKN